MGLARGEYRTLTHYTRISPFLQKKDRQIDGQAGYSQQNEDHKYANGYCGTCFNCAHSWLLIPALGVRLPHKIVPANLHQPCNQFRMVTHAPFHTGLVNEINLLVVPTVQSWLALEACHYFTSSVNPSLWRTKARTAFIAWSVARASSLPTRQGNGTPPHIW